ncbi:MAG TPA: hypothetical protein VN688_02970 [Gemmataceae bacterium]|nr:hypothetical protein [Gemmataceae bacterium]
MLREIILALLNAFLLFWVAVSPLCWILRDGLGPGSVDSHGLHSIVRFLMTFFWGPILLLLVVLRVIAGRFLGRRALHADDPEAGEVSGTI